MRRDLQKLNKVAVYNEIIKKYKKNNLVFFKNYVRFCFHFPAKQFNVVSTNENGEEKCFLPIFNKAKKRKAKRKPTRNAFIRF